jgi:hypothetical protein
MAKIIPFPSASKDVSQIVEEILATRLTHRNPQVICCLQKELNGLVERFFSGEEFAATLLLPPGLTTEQFQTIERNLQKVFRQHNDQLVRRTNALFLELCLSRITICELEQQNPSSRGD